MVKCSFCGVEKHIIYGVHVMQNDGAVNFYCSSKCRKNTLKLGRDRRKIRWAEAFHIARDKKRARAAGTDTGIIKKKASNRKRR